MGETDTCGFCGETWPCEADQRAVLADVAARRPLSAPGHATRATPVSDARPAGDAEASSEETVTEPEAVGATVPRNLPVWRRLSRPHRKAG